MSLFRSLCVALLVCVVCACSSQEDVSKAEAQVAHFHELLDAGKFDAIYAESTEDFRNASKKEDFLAFMSAVHRKLGPVVSTERTSLGVNYNTSGSFVAISFETKFQSGSGQEQFNYRLKDGAAQLVGYRINSSDLVIR